MRKYLWSGAVVALALTAGICFSARYAGRHPTSLLARMATVVYRVGFEYSSAARFGQSFARGSASCGTTETGGPAPACTPVEPDLLPDGLREQPLAVLPAIEPIQIVPERVPVDDKRGLLTPSARNPFPEITPVAADSVDDCPNVMPYCRDEETCAPPAKSPEQTVGCRIADFLQGLRLDVFGLCGERVQPGVTQPQDSAGQEEQESGAGPANRKPSGDAVNKRLESLLRDYQSPETHPVRRKVDTMEFRPSDARKGEFDRIPF
jgi:hypothetical protein